MDRVEVVEIESRQFDFDARILLYFKVLVAEVVDVEMIESRFDMRVSLHVQSHLEDDPKESISSQCGFEVVLILFPTALD